MEAVMTGHIDTVICATDLSDTGDRVLAHGKVVCKNLGARLVLCHVVDNLPPPLLTAGSAGAFAGQQRRRFAEANFRLRQMLSEPVDATLQNVEVVQGAVADQLRRLAERSGVSMVITAMRRLSWLERLTRESVTGQLLTAWPLSLLAVPERSSAGAPAEPAIHRIMVGYDFSTGARGALAMGILLSRSLGADLHLVRVQGLHTRGLAPPEARGLPVKTVAGTGRPDQALNRYAATWGADLVVVGKRRRSRMLPLGLHSTAWRMMGQAVCPVLSVSPVFARSLRPGNMKNEEMQAALV
jgi:nucleotide-binding universal stress UspA family protein